MILLSFFCNGVDAPQYQRLLRLGHCRNGNPAVVLFAHYYGEAVENDVFQAQLEWRSMSRPSVFGPPGGSNAVLDFGQDCTILAHGWRSFGKAFDISRVEARQLEVVSDEDSLILWCSGDDERRDICPPSKIVRAKKSKAAA